MRLYLALAAALLLAPNLLAQTGSPQPASASHGPSSSGQTDAVDNETHSSPLQTDEGAPSPGAPPKKPAKQPSAGNDDQTTAKDANAAPPGFDWGLVRAYFTVGDLASQERDQFSHQDLFLAFRLDKTYVTMQHFGSNGKFSFRPGLSSFFDVRLTALPVAVQTCTPTATKTCSNSSASSSSTSTTTPTTTDAFLNSQKSARLLFGVYAPIKLTQWDVATKTAGGTADDTQYALYIAPLVKTGFDTTLNGLNQTQQQSSTPTTVQSIGNTNQFYKFYDFGFRLGHYGLSKSADTAPDQLSYLDVTWGRFSNLASLLCPTAQYLGNNMCGPATPDGPAPNLAWHRDVRLNVEGLLEIPATKGFSIGFSTNVSYYHGSNKDAAFVHIQPADDLRFLFAYKFDISKIASTLSKGLAK